MSGKPLTIRAARKEEAAYLSDLALRSKAYWGYPPEFIEAVRSELTYTESQFGSEGIRFFVMECEDRVIGFHALADLANGVMELEALFVEPDCIGQGFGRRLIDHAKSMASSLGATELVIQGDPNAERFYLAAGGVLTGNKESQSIPGRLLPTFTINLTGRN